MTTGMDISFGEEPISSHRRQSLETLVILIGEIGGSAEEEAGEWVEEHFDRPVVGLIAGRTAPPAAAWATPAPSSREARARPRTRWKPSPATASTSWSPPR